MRNLVVVVILFCTVSFELVSASPGFFGGCGCGLGRRKRDASSPGDPLEGLVLEAPLWTEDAHECPQNRWKSIMRKAMNESVDAIHAKFSIQRAIESELGDHFFIACADHKPSFVANGDAFCSYGEKSRSLFCYVIALFG